MTLHDAIAKGDVNEVQSLLAKGVNPNTQNSYGSALGWAAEKGSEAIIELLLKFGADLENEKQSTSPFGRAIRYARTGAARLLAERGAACDFRYSDGGSPLTFAILYNDAELVGAILNQLKPSSIDNDALALAARHTDLPVVTLLVKAGARINGFTLLKAVAGGRPEVVRYLLSNGADVTTKDQRGVNALMKACEAGQFEIAKLLIENGAPLNEIENEKGDTALSLARNAAAAALVELLIAHGAQERGRRSPKEGEEFLAITDCPVCSYLPQEKTLNDSDEPEDIPGLSAIHRQVTHPDRYTTVTEIIRRCADCGTYYVHHHSIDTEDSAATPPRISHSLERCNLLKLADELRKARKRKELDQFLNTYPHLIEEFQRVLRAAPSGIHPNILPHIVESVAESAQFTAKYLK